MDCSLWLEFHGTRFLVHPRDILARILERKQVLWNLSLTLCVNVDLA